MPRRAPDLLLLIAAAAAGATGGAACGAAPGEPIAPARSAVATPSCGPTDGPAVEIVLSAAFAPVARPVPPFVRVNVAVRLDALPGRTWRIGDAAFALRQPATGPDEAATRGSVTVTRVSPDTSVFGRVDLTFPSGARVRQPFAARWVPAPPGPLCG